MSEQLGLFGAIPGPRKTTVTEYYLGMSSMQKFIRRGMSEYAINAARYVFDWNSSALRRRLITICMEDIGLGDIEQVLSQLRILKAGRLSFEAYCDVIKILCLVRKNRDADDALLMVAEARAGRPVDVDFLDPSEFEFLLCNAIYMDGEHRRDEFWVWANREAERRDPRCHEMIVFLESLASISGHACHLALLIIARWAALTGMSVRVETNDLVGDAVRVWGRAFCDLGMDGHTRPGAEINARIGSELGMEPADVHAWDFFGRGARLNCRAVWRNDYRDLVTPFFMKGIDPDKLIEASRLLRLYRRDKFREMVIQPN